MTDTKMLFIGGAKLSYRCEVCGSNCFHPAKPDDPNKYECNGCGAWYTSEPEPEEAAKP